MATVDTAEGWSRELLPEGYLDHELKEILRHNRDEEVEHAMMVLEWIRRNDAVFAKQAAKFLGKAGGIVGHEEEEHAETK